MISWPELKTLRASWKKRVIVVIDACLEELYGKSLAHELQAELIAIPAKKNQETADLLLRALFEKKCGRDTVLIAVGGGTTTDLVGFVASIYLRGIDLVLVPTTLLGVVDAAIGGKNGIDTPFGKNLLGTFYPPLAVCIHLPFLNTLSEQERFNGQAEILKLGLVYDASLWNDPSCIERAVRGKQEIVERDPKEKGLRRILNFGHTIAHGLERVSEYEMAHGLAVAIGCVAEAHLSSQLGYLSDFAPIEKVYRKFSLRLPKQYSRSGLIEAMAHDKKKEQGKLRFVLIDQIGRAAAFDGAYCRAVTQEELEPTLDWMEAFFGQN
jgi:3-dehydroquinate synthase